jgi:uncharacterized protein YkwD
MESRSIELPPQRIPDPPRQISRRVRSTSPATHILTLSMACGGIGLMNTRAEGMEVLTASTKPQVVIDLSNVPRLAKGCPALKKSVRLTKAAQKHAADMAANKYFSHTSRDGRTWVERIAQAGWKKPAGENIASGFTAAASVLTGWMDSAGHRRNILDCSFRYIGVGYAPKGNYWVQDFGY